MPQNPDSEINAALNQIRLNGIDNQLRMTGNLSKELFNSAIKQGKSFKEIVDAKLIEINGQVEEGKE